MGLKDHLFEDRTAALRAAGQPFAIVTVVRTVNATSAKPGAKAIVTSDGSILEGWVGGGCIRAAVRKAALTAIAEGTTQFISLRPEEIRGAEGLKPGDSREGIQFARNGCPSKGSMDIFVEPVLPQTQLVICGDGPVAMALADLATRFELTVALCATKSFEFSERPNGPQIIVIATQGNGDADALRAAVNAAPEFTTFVGSRRKFDTLAAELIDQGMSAAALGKVKSPAGLDIGAITPDEIALSILSEIVLNRRSLQRSKWRTADTND